MSGAKNLQVSPQSNQKSEYKYEYGRSERLIFKHCRKHINPGRWGVICSQKTVLHHANGNLWSTKHHRDTNSGMADEACEVHPAGNREQAFTRTDTLRARTFCHHIWNRTQHITDIDPEPSYDSSALPWFLTRTWVIHIKGSAQKISVQRRTWKH